MKKIGIIRCMQTEDICPGTTDFKAVKEGNLAFEETGPGEVVGFVSCGGCPGKKVIKRAEKLVEKGAEIIAFASCMKKGNPLGFPCPHFAQIKEAAEKNLKDKVIFIDWTH
ncbi:MAG: CGGC domain-containing protein [Clostridia bacterium]|nr:CGGC domain-containing protein [Clostridia bacterium]